MGFSRQEYWSGLLFPSPGDLPDPRIEPRSPALEAEMGFPANASRAVGRSHSRVDRAGVWGSVPAVLLCARLTHLGCPQLLNCIMDMAEKTRRSLTVLRRCQEADREELNPWIRRCSDAAEDSKKGPGPTARPLGSSVGTEGAQLGVLGGMCGAEAGGSGARPSLVMALQGNST